MTRDEEDIMWKMNGQELREWKASGLSITAWRHKQKVSKPMTPEEDAAHDEVVEKINDLGNDELLELYNAQVADPKCCWMFLASNQIEVYGNPYIECRAKEVIKHQEELAEERQAEEHARWVERDEWIEKQQAEKWAIVERLEREQAEREANPNWGAFT